MGYWCSDCHNVFDNKFDLEKMQCKQCQSFNVIYVPDDLSVTFGEFFIISKISKDKNFCQAMINLKQSNPIEYELKMAQFKSTLSQQNAEENAVKCPRCGNTNIQMVPRKFSLLTGFMTNKVDRMCMNCKHKF